MNIRSYFISTALGTLILLVWQVINTFLSMGFLRSGVSSMLTNPQNVPPEALPQVLGGSLLFACVGMLVSVAAYAGSGFLYTYLHHRQDELTTEQAMIGGTAVGASIGVAGVIINTLLFLVTQPMMQQTMQQLIPSGNMPPQPFSPGMLSFSIVGTLAGMCIGGVIAALVGFLGGLIGGIVFKSQA